VIALLVGAGFGKWAADLPLTHELFDLAVEPWGFQERRRLMTVAQRSNERIES
jgi:hypothetical protein